MRFLQTGCHSCHPSNKKSLFVRFDGHLPCRCGLAGTRMTPFWILLELRVMEVVVTNNWSYKTCKAPVKMSNKPSPSFLQAGCPSCRPANSVKALKGIHPTLIERENKSVQLASSELHWKWLLNQCVKVYAQSAYLSSWHYVRFSSVPFTVQMHWRWWCSLGQFVTVGANSLGQQSGRSPRGSNWRWRLH